MSMSRSTRTPGVPTPPQGDPIASYDTYLEAQRAVDHLSDKEFPVQNVTIVGTDLRMVERVTGRLTYPRVALAGLGSGAWFGLFVGVVLYFFSPPGEAVPLIAPIAIGAAFGMLFGVISYALTGGKRDFTSSSQIVASSYTLLCLPEHASAARSLLSDGGPGLGRGARGPAVAAAAPTATTPQQPTPPAPAAVPQTPPPTAPQAPPTAPAPGGTPPPPSSTPPPHGDPTGPGPVPGQSSDPRDRL